MTATATNFIALPTAAIKELEPRTLGIFATLLSLGEGVRQEDVANASGLSSWVVRGAFREMEEKGYLVRTYKHEGGRLRGVVWTARPYPPRDPEAVA
ncbi:hypothetical protein ABT282_08305 [Streptomyces sp. NPDC000927]|uniref:hypothetical protein n=1 Tax=Streptomyces sp. NPDC000927 TaxID=3154371 RepID=UPI003319E8B0